MIGPLRPVLVSVLGLLFTPWVHWHAAAALPGLATTPLDLRLLRATEYNISIPFALPIPSVLLSPSFSPHSFPSALSPVS